ncbi:hypothetical protein ERJ75_000557500 [Trypanosoma vivax]|nr:hypothetical protein ERJ75_000557500 [Trypanosoma vivax]
MAGEIDGMIGTLATHNRGKSGQNGVSCIGDGSAAAASTIKSTLAGYRQTQLKACVTASAEEMDNAKFEAQLNAHATALTLVDGLSDTNAVVSNPDGAETYCAFFTGKTPATRCSTAPARATPTWPRHGEACGKSPKLETDKTSSSTPPGEIATHLRAGRHKKTSPRHSKH